MKSGLRALLTSLLVTTAAGSAFAASKQVVFNEIMIKTANANSSQDQLVELRNTGGTSIDVSGWTFCHQFNYGSVIPQGTSIPANGYLVCHFNKAGTNGNGHVYFGTGQVLSTTSDLGLYTNNNDFGNPLNMHAFIQFGGVPGSGRQGVASSANLWTMNTFVPVPSTGGNSVELCNNDATTTTSWSPTTNPTIGVMNGCGVAVEATSWGAVKALFFH